MLRIRCLSLDIHHILRIVIIKMSFPFYFAYLFLEPFANGKHNISLLVRDIFERRNVHVQKFRNLLSRQYCHCIFLVVWLRLVNFLNHLRLYKVFFFIYCRTMFLDNWILRLVWRLASHCHIDFFTICYCHRFSITFRTLTLFAAIKTSPVYNKNS